MNRQDLMDSERARHAPDVRSHCVFDTDVLDVGCGQAKHEGALGVDITGHSDADLTHDLNEYPYPLPSDHFRTVYCHDIIEHVDSIDAFVRELHRVSAPGGILKIRTPHFSSWYAYNDPTHRSYLGYFFLDHYVTPSTITDHPLFEYVARRFLFPRAHRLTGASRLANKYPARYEQMFCFLFPCENMVLELRVIK